MDGYGIQVNRQRDRRFVPLPESLQGGDWEEITPGEQLEAKPAIAPPAKQWSEISPGEYDHIVNPPEETPWTQRPIPVLGNVEEMLTLPKGIVHGTQQLAAGAGAGMQWLGNRLDSKLITEAGKKVSDYYQKQAKAMGPPKSIAGKNLWDNPELLINPSYWIYNTADMAPSLAAAMIPAMGAAKAIQIGGQAIRLSPQVIARLSSLGAAATGGAVGGAMEGSQTYQTVLGEGGSEEEAARAGELMTVLAGTLNAVGMGKILSRAGNDFKGKVVKRLGAGVWEGLTEAAEEPAEVTSRLLAKYLEGEELPKEIGPMFVDSLKQAITVFPVAGITGGTATFAGPKGAPAPEKEILGWEMVPEEEEPIDLVDVVEPEDKKLLNAIKTEVKKGNLTVDQVETLREQAKERYPGSKEIHEEFDKLIAKMGQVETPGEREGLVPVAVTGELAKKPAKESAEVFEKELAEEEELRRSERGGRLLKEQLAGEEAMEIAAEAEGAIKPIPYEELYPEEEGWEEISEEEISEEAAPEKPTLEGELEEITEDELDDLITEAAEEAETEPTEAQIEAGKSTSKIIGASASINIGGQQFFSDTSLTDTKLFGNQIHGHAIRTEGFDSLDVKIKPIVMRNVRAAIRNKKILNSIIRSIPVDVMNDLVGKKTSADMLLNNPSMLLNNLPISGNTSVASSRLINTIASMVNPETSSATEDMFLSKKSGRPSVDDLSTSIAGDIRHGIDITQQKPKSKNKVPTDQEIFKQTDLNPTEKQIEAGNYKKASMNLHGLEIKIENPKGSTRRGVDREGKEWETTMKHPYGYIRGTKGKDKDHLDVFIGPNPASDRIYVIDQIVPETGKFDEHKIMLAFETEKKARVGYLANYEPGWKGIGSVTGLSMNEFKEWIKGDTTKPISRGLRELQKPPMEEIRKAPVEEKGMAKGKVAPPEKKAKIEGKEPWEITQTEWIDGHIKSPGMHREHVRRALSEGKPVPKEVLAGYPQLKKVPEPATIPPVTEKPGKAAEPTEETPKAEGGVEYNKRAIRKYGTTTIPESMGFITREGKAIDSSGIKQGSRSQGRNIDHREIAQEALGDVAKADSWSASMHQFMEETGDIRVVGAKDEFNIDVPIIKGMPSDKQLALLRKISSGKKIYYDFTGKNGNIVKSGEGLYSDFLRDLKQSVKGEREISESLAQGKVPKQLKPLEDFIREHGLTKNEVVDARFNRDNPLYNDFRKAMDKTTVGVTKLWSDFGFKNVEDFYNKVIKPSPKPPRPPEVGGAIGEPVTYDVTGKVEQPKTPYKVSEEAQDLLDDIRQPDKDALSTARGKMGRAGAGVKTLASALKEEATQTGRIDLRGKVVRTPEDLAVLAQVYRNPRFETLRIFYVKDNIIVAHEGITSRMPSFSAAFSKRPQYDLYKMRDRMKRLGADGYYLLHNHPKGDPKASDADARVTAKYASEVPGFKAHVIIDSGTYFVFGENYYQLMSNMIGYKRDLPGLPPNWKDPLIPEGIAIGGVEKINGPRDVAKMGQALKTKDDYVVLLYRGNNAKCQAIQEMPLDLFSNIKEASNYIRGRMRQFGASQVVAYVDKPEIVTDIFGEKMPGRELIKNGTLVDVVYNLQPGKEAIAESRYPGVFTQPDMIAGIHEEDFPAIRVEESRVIEDVWRSGTERPFAFDPNSTMNEGRFRLRDPDQFDEAAYTIKDKPTKFISRSKKNDIQEEGIRFIVGKVDGEEQIQAIRFNKNIWPEEKAAEWWEENRETFKPEWKTKTEVAKALDEKEWANKWIDNILKKAEEEEKKKAEIQDKETITQAKRIRKEQDYFEKDYPEDTKTTAREVITHIKKRKNFDWEEGKPDTSVLERLIASPEFYFEKVPAAWKVFEAGLNRTDEYFMNFNQMTMEEGESLLGKIKQLQKDRSIEYRKLKNLITYADRNKITYTEEGLRDKGFSDQAVEAWKSYRRIMDNGFDALFAEMRDIIEKHEAAGIPLPQVVTHVAGKRVQVDLKTALAQMGSMRGYYAPRARRAGKYMLVAKKEGVSPILEFYDIKITPAAPMQIRAKKLRSQGYHVTLSKAKTMPEDVFQLAGKTIGLQSMINTALDRIKKDTPATLEDYGLTGEMKERDYLLRGPFNPAMTKAFKMLGGKWFAYPAGEPRAWHFIDPPKDIERRIINALGGIEETALDTETAFAFSLATELANIVKGRGFRSSMIKRGAELGKEVWAGYEEDPLKAATQYASGIAAGMAKKNMAGKMMRAITGTDIPWSEFEGTYEEYMDHVKRNRIDPTTQPNIFRDATVYMEEMLRNEEFSDRVIGVIKGITVLKYLGGRLSAPLVNLTALITSVPASMNGYANIPIHKTFGLIGKAMDEYAKYRFGNREEMDPDLVRLFDHIYEKGWGTPQYNREALSVLKSKFGSGWNRAIDYAMLLFGATEHLNRVSTIAGTYIGLKEQKVRMSRENMLMTAKKTSDRAHGIYGKATLPHYAQGKNIASYAIKAFYVFSKFSHTYLQNMYQLGFKQGNKKALTCMMVAPAIISGYTAAPIVVEVLNIALSRLLGVDDPEEDFYSWLEENLGELASDFARFGLFGVLLGVSLKGSLRIDMHRGIPTTLPELVGAPGNVLTDVYYGGKDIIKGRPYRGIEKLAPRMVGQPMQAIREYREGVTTRLGVPKYLGKERMEPSMTDSVLKFLTFNPAGIAKQKEQKWSETKKVQKYQGMRTEIYALIRDYYNKPASQRSKARWAEIMLKVDDYNDRVSEKDLVGIRGLSLITRESIRTALRQYR